MNLPRYDIIPDKDLHTFNYNSEGKNGAIQKVVFYQEIEPAGVFNLALGDRNPITGEIDDKSVSDNGDTEKVLATVVSTVYAFLDDFPNAYIYAEGSTHSRNRLYRRGITKYLTEALEDFIIYGLLANKEVELFNPNTDYVGFLIHRKIN